MKGWIVLDIDGTITLDRYSVPEPVVAYLKHLTQEGWRLGFATGRAFVFAIQALHGFDFPYILLPQNGSVALEMPHRKVLFKQYLSSETVDLLEAAFSQEGKDFLVYAGFDHRDRVYWRPERFSFEDRQYVEELQKREKEEWIAVKEFDWEKLNSFPLVKGFGEEKAMRNIARRLGETSHFQIATIRDPFHPSHMILLITDSKASKGSSLGRVFAMLGRGERVIGAGDDENDRSLLQVADCKIAMPHAPPGLQEMADWIAPPTEHLGIIHVLEMVLKNERS